MIFIAISVYHRLARFVLDNDGTFLQADLPVQIP